MTTQLTLDLTRPEPNARIIDEVRKTTAASRRAGHVTKTLRRFGTLLRSHVVASFAALYVALVLISALLPQWFTRADPYATAPAQSMQAPSAAHWFGTDKLGRDVFTRVVYGGRTTISASLVALAIAVIAGLALGVIAGYAGGVLDALLMRFVDVWLAIPGLLLAITIVTAIGFGTLPVAIAIGVGICPTFARTTRSQVLRVKQEDYIEAARTSGSSDASIVVNHILPNAIGPVAVLALLDFGGIIMAVATLSFLGFGVKPPEAEWGSLINDGRDYLLTAPWLSILPGLVVVATVLAITVLGNAVKKELK